MPNHLHDTVHAVVRATASLCDRAQDTDRCRSIEANALRAAIAVVLESEHGHTRTADEPVLSALHGLMATLAHIAG